MFYLAFAIGVYSYFIFFLGIFGLLYKNIIIGFSIIYLFLILLYFLKFRKFSFKFRFNSFNSFSKLLIILISIQAVINFIGVIGPEIGFDALWYHLTLPKIFLENHKIFHISGNLLYYSDMPKNIEMIYIAALSFNGEILAKLTHFIFGLLCIFAIYKISRFFLSQNLSLLSSLIFYSNLIVGWESISAYIDLGTTFFELTAFYAFIKWIKNKNTEYLIYCAVFVGFSVSTKMVSLGSIFIYSLLIMLFFQKNNIKLNLLLKNLILFLVISVFISLPWFIFSFLNTGNPFYPALEQMFVLNNARSIDSLFRNILFPADPINPIYIILFPLVLIFLKSANSYFKYVAIYVFSSLIFWLFIVGIGGSRFLLPYLGVFSVLCSLTINKITNKNIKYYLIGLALVISLISIGYRFLANQKYIPYLLKTETKGEFLSNNLNFSFGDFYDVDGYFKKNINSSNKVLLYGFHNLYYVDFPYIDSSWVKKDDKFNYIAVQKVDIPNRFSDGKLIYYNKITKVKLYTNNDQLWTY